MAKKNSDKGTMTFDRGHSGNGNLKGAVPPMAKGSEDADGVNPETGGSRPMPKPFTHNGMKGIG